MANQFNLAACRVQRDQFLAMIAENPSAADQTLHELVASMTELIDLEELNRATDQLDQKPKLEELDSNDSALDVEEAINAEDGPLIDELDVATAEAAISESLLHLQCRVPFQHAWGQMRYSNAMVQSVEATPATAGVEDVQVSVLFLQPTHRSMVPCAFFLDGKCRFAADQCHFSHGETYPLSELKPYEPPDFSALKVGGTCLYAGGNDIWEYGVVTEIHPFNEETCETAITIRKREGNGVITISHHLVMPDSNDDLNETEDPLDPAELYVKEKDEDSQESQPDSEDEFTPHAAWDLPVSQVSHGFAGWEAHTTGIGSRLMAHMGYVVGQGLGITRSGRTEPVAAYVLPKGKSLDYCMALRDGRDLPAVGAKRRRLKVPKTAQPPSQQKPKQSVFDFLNKNLRHPAAAKRSQIGPVGPVKTDSSRTSTGPSTSTGQVKDAGKQLNIESLKNHDAVSAATKELDRLRTALSRTGMDKASAKVLNQRIKAKEDDLAQLRRQGDALQKTKDNHKARKSLALF